MIIYDNICTSSICNSNETYTHIFYEYLILVDLVE